jgi:hypothetical protein
MNLQTDVLIIIFLYLPPKEILKCEVICKRWESILSRNSSYLWKKKIYHELSNRDCFDYGWTRYWLSLLDELENESWKTIYRLWSEWNNLDLTYQMNPELISADQFYYADSMPQLWKLKLGEIENGKVTCCSTTAIRAGEKRVCYNRGPKDPFELEQTNFKNSMMTAKPVRFTWQPHNTHISLEKSTRSELEVLQEYGENSKCKVIRIWDPLVLPQGPYLPFVHGDLDIEGLWIIRGEISFIGLCKKLLVILVDRDIFVLELGVEKMDQKTAQFHYSCRMQILWKCTLTLSHNISSITINEGLLGILCTQNHQYVELYHIHSGSLFSRFTLLLDQSPGHSSVEIHFALSRFHAIVYDCDQLVVYDLLRIKNGELLQCSRTKIPYVGRDIRIELSEDGAFFMLSPTIHHGEVVLVDVLKQSSTSYLLQKCHFGPRLLKGCWLVFQDRKHQATNASTKVVWSPIYT